MSKCKRNIETGYTINAFVILQKKINAFVILQKKIVTILQVYFLSNNNNNL